ncbi:hypothetical protein NDU88_002694 [Pleurodeles waltl]|uniref:Uncharacterized protein n=1 Tax=Pleurodeles waltl TaxID=8319 RepID=A0AAV7RCN3_PLEWA|nr:hypothetical protein NDU88_002694 [Pleurodeles waltl]
MGVFSLTPHTHINLHNHHPSPGKKSQEGPIATALVHEKTGAKVQTMAEEMPSGKSKTTQADRAWHQITPVSQGQSRSEAQRQNKKMNVSGPDWSSTHIVQTTPELRKSTRRSPVFDEQSELEKQSQPEKRNGKGTDWSTVYSLLMAITTATTMNTDKMNTYISVLQTLVSYTMAIEAKMEKLNSLITREQTCVEERTQYFSCSPGVEKLSELPDVMKDMIIEIEKSVSAQGKLDASPTDGTLIRGTMTHKAN